MYKITRTRHWLRPRRANLYTFVRHGSWIMASALPLRIGIVYSPFSEHLRALFLADIRLKDHAILLVDFLQLIEFFPYVNGEARGDSGTKRCGFAHSGAVDRDANDVRLCLWRILASHSGLRVMSWVH